MCLTEAYELFRVRYIALRGLSSSTEDNYSLAVLSFIRGVGDLPIEKILPQDVLVWRRFMEKSCQAGTIRAYMSKLKNILIFTNKLGLTTFDTTEIYLPKLPPPLPEFLLPDEVTTMIDCCLNIRDRLLISLMFCSGMRAGELCRLDKADVVGNQVFIRQGKCHSSRMVFMDSRTINLLSTYLLQRTDKTPQIFYSSKKGRLITSTINKIVKGAAVRANIDKPVHSHMLRHSFATTLVREGVDISYVQRMLGHAFVNTTMLYVHLTNSDLQGAYSKVFK